MFRLLEIKERNEKETVFYFPGCGSERLYSQVSVAVIGMLHDLDIQTVLPPGYLCCGYPQAGNGMKQKSEEIVTRNRVLFHRIANTFELQGYQYRVGQLRYVSASTQRIQL